MKTKNFLYFLFALSIGILTAVSCEKDSERTADIAVMEDDAISELVFEDIYSEVEFALAEMESMLFDGIKKSELAVTCKTVTVEHPDDSILWPRTITIDYGDGCTGPNGVVRKGKIVTVVNNGKRALEGYSRTSTFIDYFVDDLQIEGTRVLTNEGKNDAGNIVFSEVLTGGKVTKPDGKVLSREFEREREWVTGFNTARFRFDDEYMVTGTTTGIDRKDRAFTRTITAPLHVKLSCRWIVAGTVLSQVEGLPEAILDYGDGECDRKATVTVGDVAKDILLHR